MILLFIIGISLIQFGLYYLNNTYKTKIPSLVILLAVLICYFFVFPKLFYPKPSINRINCGMPIFAITLSFWFFGTITGITTHIIWKLFKYKSTKK